MGGEGKERGGESEGERRRGERGEGGGGEKREEEGEEGGKEGKALVCRTRGNTRSRKPPFCNSHIMI